jgi:hypothetical protein
LSPGLLALSMVLQAAQVQAPALAFPEPGLDDTTAYQGYQTRFYRDSKGNTIQIYVEPRGGRVVHVWADAADESLGFSVRDPAGHPAPVEWGGEVAEASDSAALRTVEYPLDVRAPRVQLGWFLLGSMRVERDFVYAGRHLKPFPPASPPFYVAEESLLVANVARLPVNERRTHLGLLSVESVAELRARLQPSFSSSRTDSLWVVRVERPSLDGRNHLALELRVDPRRTAVRVAGQVVWLRALADSSVHATVRVTTDAAPLTPLARDSIFEPGFLAFLAGARDDSAGDTRRRRLEREVRSVELLASQEKLMAGLPNFATYFGRDMMMTALMMRPIWRPAMTEHVIAGVLRKLGPEGDVSHEEALGGQAIRENGQAYNDLLAAYFRNLRARRQAKADSALDAARGVLSNLQKVRENYHMIDDEFQLPVLAARYLTDSAVPDRRKKDFLLDTTETGDSRLARLLREMALVSTMTGPYALEPIPNNLVSFVKRDSAHWRSASWRDSDAGYAGGRYAMDVNAIWAPRALEAMSATIAALSRLGFGARALDSIEPGVGGTPLGSYLTEPASLRKAIETWKGARRHFVVAMGPGEVQARVGAKLAWLPEGERHYWENAMTDQGELGDSLTFLALSLDSLARPIPIVNSDPATGLFLGGDPDPQTILGDVEPFMRLYPVGLLVGGLGPVAANDAYASREVWDRFKKDSYHGPRVVWGREVNLFLLGVAQKVSAAFDSSGALRDPTLDPYVQSLRDALERTLAAVKASGLEHSELWSYRIEDGRLVPTRYGTGSDVQLWSTTDLAVQFALSRVPAR